MLHRRRSPVDFDVYRIRTKISEQGSTVEAGLVTKFRSARRKVLLEKLDEDVVYDASQLDRDVCLTGKVRDGTAHAWR